MEVANGPASLDREQPREPILCRGGRFPEAVVVGRHRRERRAREVVADGVGDDEVAIREPLHQRAGAQAVRAVVAEVGLAEHVQARQVAHQVVVDPEPTHRVVDGRVDPHRHRVRILVGDPLVHVEQVAVARLDGLDPQPRDGIGEVEIHRQARLADAAPVVAHRFRVARCDVARHEVAEAGVLALEVIVALALRDLLGTPRVAGRLRNPDAGVVAQRFAHQRELRLVLAADRDAGRMDLREARVCEEGAALVGPPRRGDVRLHGVGREVVGRAVPAGREHDRVRGVRLDLARDQVAGDDPARLAVDDHEVEHLAAGEHAHGAGAHLPHQRLVRAEQQLLARLAARVERARDLRAAERSVVEHAAVLARERHALRDALVDDLHRQLREPVDVGLPRAVVAALDGVVEQAVDGVAVVLVVLRRVDAALRGDAVGAPRAVVDAVAVDVVAELGERRRRRRPGEPRAHDDDRVLALVRRVDELDLEPVAVPLLGQRAGRAPSNRAS